MDYQLPHEGERWFQVAFAVGLFIFIIYIIFKIGKLLEVFLFYSFVGKM